MVRRKPLPRKDPPPGPSRAKGASSTAQNPKKKKRVKRNHVSQEHRDFSNVDEQPDDATIIHSEEVLAADTAFCCTTCVCPPERIDKVCGGLFIQSGDGMVHHRRCCHGAFFTDDTWAGPYETIAYAETVPEAEEKGPYVFSAKEVHKQYESYKNQEQQAYDGQYDPEPAGVLNLSSDYRENRRWFEELAKKIQHDKKPVTVLDVFAGVGTASVVLKRLGIAILKVIVCEHDKVATHVYRWNHDDSYNTDLKESHNIEYVYYSKFEDIESNLDGFLEAHGPIDLIIGGPPCVDYSAVNAFRKGTEGIQGSYMLRLATMIGHISKKQERPLFYCVENVVIRNDSEVPLKDEDLEKLKDAFGWDYDPIVLDAKYVSPCVRKRLFFTNIPSRPLDHPTNLSPIAATLCLEDGYKLAAHCFEQTMSANAWTFMASASRIDTTTMLVYKETESGEYEGRYMTAEEREIMMGYPRGYVSKSVESLFQTLQNDGMAIVTGKHWKEVLDEKYHHFNGGCHGKPDAYRVGMDGYVLSLSMLPQGSKSHFNSSSYAKRLVGNAFSVPIMEHLLKALQIIYAEEKYERFSCKYEWETAVADTTILEAPVEELGDGDGVPPESVDGASLAASPVKQQEDHAEEEGGLPSETKVTNAADRDHAECAPAVLNSNAVSGATLQNCFEATDTKDGEVVVKQDSNEPADTLLFSDSTKSEAPGEFAERERSSAVTENAHGCHSDIRSGQSQVRIKSEQDVDVLPSESSASDDEKRSADRSHSAYGSTGDSTSTSRRGKECSTEDRQGENRDWRPQTLTNGHRAQSDRRASDCGNGDTYRNQSSYDSRRFSRAGDHGRGQRSHHGRDRYYEDGEHSYYENRDGRRHHSSGVRSEFRERSRREFHRSEEHKRYYQSHGRGGRKHDDSDRYYVHSGGQENHSYGGGRRHGSQGGASDLSYVRSCGQENRSYGGGRRHGSQGGASDLSHYGPT